MKNIAQHTRLSIFIPSYNAGDLLPPLLQRIPKEVMNITRYIYIINDGSADNTYEVSKELEKYYNNIRSISFEKNQGYGIVVKKGLDLSKEDGCDVSICLHADGQYPPEYILPIVELMLKYNYDIIQGSRLAHGHAVKNGMPVYKYIAGKILTGLENMVFGNRMTDRHSGFLFYKREALNKITYHRLSDSFDIDLELLASAYANGLRVSEYPIPTRYAGEVSYLNPFTYGFRVLKVLAKFTSNKYSTV